jgi:prophage regulatory protein
MLLMTAGDTSWSESGMNRKPPQSERQLWVGTPTSFAVADVAFLRLPEVKAVTGLSKTTLYSLIRDRSFPAPVPLAPRVVAWVKSEVNQWAAERIVAARSGVCRPNERRGPHPSHLGLPASGRKSA